MSAGTLQTVMAAGRSMMAGTATSGISITGAGKADTGGMEITRGGSAGGGSSAPIGIGTQRRSIHIRTRLFHPVKRPASGIGATRTSNTTPMSAHARRDGEQYRLNSVFTKTVVMRKRPGQPACHLLFHPQTQPLTGKGIELSRQRLFLVAPGRSVTGRRRFIHDLNQRHALTER